MAWQIFYFPIFFFIFLYLKNSNLANLKFHDYIFLSSIIFIFISLAKPLSTDIINKLRSIKLSSENIFNTQLIDSLKNNYFHQDKFVINGLKGSEFKNNFKKLVPDIIQEDFLCLGDDAYLYPLFNKKPYKYISLYNVSPSIDQKVLISQLETKRPKYVIFNRNFKVFDALPNIVRVPILYKYIVKNYNFKINYGVFDVLEIKTETDKEDLKYWQEIFGHDINLEFLINKSDFVPLPCKNFDKCENYLELVTIDDFNKDYIELEFKTDNLSEIVKFKFNRNQSKIYIKLDHFWFIDYFFTSTNHQIKVPDEFEFKLIKLRYNENLY